MTDLLGDRAVDTVDAYARSRQPFLLSCISPRRTGRGRARTTRPNRDGSATSLHRDGGTQKTYRPDGAKPRLQYRARAAGAGCRGLSDNTIVIFTSDNGGERFSDTWPFTGRKQELLEGGLRIPAIIRWPGQVGGGSVSDQAISPWIGCRPCWRPPERARPA